MPQRCLRAALSYTQIVTLLYIQSLSHLVLKYFPYITNLTHLLADLGLVRSQPQVPVNEPNPDLLASSSVKSTWMTMVLGKNN